MIDLYKLFPFNVVKDTMVCSPARTTQGGNSELKLEGFKRLILKTYNKVIMPRV